MALLYAVTVHTEETEYTQVNLKCVSHH